MGVDLAAVADRQDPDPGGQLGRHIQDLLAVADQPMSQHPAEAWAPSTAQQRSGQRPAHWRRSW